MLTMENKNIIDNEKFMEWLTVQLEQRGWSRYKLAIKAGISKTSISNIYNNKRGIGPELCQAIAEALVIPAAQVYEMAGILPERRINRELEQINHQIASLPPDLYEDAKKYIDYLTQKSGEKFENGSNRARSLGETD